METEQSKQRSLHVRQEQLLTFVRAMIGGNGEREDDEHPLPPGPWDTVIRTALGRIDVFGPHTEPWKAVGSGSPWQTTAAVLGPHADPRKFIFASILERYPAIWDALGGGHGFSDEVALNPQPLPPRFAFLISLAQTVISRAELIHEIADATRREDERHGIIIVSGYITRFVDDICGNGFKFNWTFPGPRPNWLAKEVSGIDLVVMATTFDQAAKETFSRKLRQNLADASAKLAAAGMTKLK